MSSTLTAHLHGRRALRVGIVLIIVLTASAGAAIRRSHTIPPTAPPSARVTAADATSLTLSWGASSGGVGAKGYSLTIDGSQAGKTTQLSWRFTGLTCGTSHALSIRAYDAAGNYSPADRLTASTAACPSPQSSGPTAPGSLRVTSTQTTSLSVAWNASTDNVPVLGYHAYLNQAFLAHVMSGTSYVFTNLACGTSYLLSIDAFDGAGKVSSPAALTASTAACASPPKVSGTSGTTPVAQSVTPPTSTTTTTTTTPTTTTPTTPTTTTTVSRPPSPPTGLAVSAATTTGLTLSWVAPTGTTPAQAYNVSLSTTVVARTTALSYTFSGLGCGTTYTLSVASVSSSGLASSPATLSGATAACPPPPPAPAPPAPAPVPQSTPPSAPAGQANVSVSPSGSDSSCARSAAAVAVSKLTACRTFEKAYQVAQPGDTVAVLGGAYGADYPNEGATKLLSDSSKSSAAHVTFVCGDSGTVTFAAPSDQFVITAQHVTIQGGCFNFNRLWIGDGSNGISTSDVTIDGVSMMMFDISGSSNVTIENSQVGPDVACYGPGSGSTSCQDIASDHEAYFAESGRPNTNFAEPKIHDGGPSGNTPPSNITISNDTFLEIQSRDPVNLHAGCLWIGYGASGGPVSVTGSTFNGCMTYDIHVDTPTTPSLSVTNNTFGAPRDALRGGTDFASVAQLGPGQVDYEVKCQSNEVISNYTITGNTFSHGYDLDAGGCSNPSYRGMSISGNVGGMQNPAGA